jgi:hypothetical protein
MLHVANPTPFSTARIRETVQEILAAGTLPPIVQAGHPVLRQQAALFDGQLDSAELAALIALMREVMHDAPGVGLAAPQLGIPLQLAVLEDQYDVDAETSAVRARSPLDFFAVINPPTGRWAKASRRSTKGASPCRGCRPWYPVRSPSGSTSPTPPESRGSRNSPDGRRGSCSTRPTTCRESYT